MMASDIKAVLSDKFKEAIKEEFKDKTVRLELIINQGGIQSGEITYKLK